LDVDPQRRRLARAPFEPVVEYLGADARPTGEDVEGAQRKSVAAYAVFFFMFISIFSSSQYLLQGLAEEKEHRVMEMVLSSVTADELMRGKLIGLGAAGLLQFAVWLGMLLSMTLFTPLVAVALAPATFAICLVYFLLGYALFGSLMLGFGVLGTNARESQQMASIWSFIGISPSFVMVALFENPHGLLARVFSFVPFTAPTTMMFRFVVDPRGTSAREILLGMVLLAASTWLALKVSARLFRAGLLLYGKRPTPREIWKWMVLSARP
ncbi:MAG TPA: ABC transporter permease, partial [Planctomycetota bacterium]|nr:ABC transporter permease [Planctomycetota bacterium]